MATEIAFSATVETGEGAKSLRSLKEEFKNTQKELDGLTVGSERYVETLKKLGGIKDEIGDLNAEINSFNPEGKIQAFTNVLSGVASGFQVVTGAAALFGTENKDLEKTLVKLQAVMAFTEGIKGITSLSDGFSVLTTNLKSTALGTKILTGVQRIYNAVLAANPIALVVTALAALTTGIILAIRSEESAIAVEKKIIDGRDRQIKQLKELKDALSSQQEFELNFAKAKGESIEDLRKLEDKQLSERLANLRDLRDQTEEQISNISKARLKASDDEKKELKEKQDELIKKEKDYSDEITSELRKRAIQQQQRITEDLKSKDEADEKAREKNKQYLEKVKADREKHEQELQKFRDAEAKWDEEQAKKKKERDLELFNIENQQREEAIAEATKWLDDYNKNILAGAELRSLQFKNDLDAQLAYLEAQKQNELLNKELTENEKLVISEKYKQQEVELTKKYKIQEAQESLQIAQQSTQALQGLSDLFFSIKMANVKKGSKEEEAAARKQFKINKALSIASTLISGAQGVVNGLSAPYPQNIILPVLAGITTAASIAKISATQFESTNSGGGNIPDLNKDNLKKEPPLLNAPNGSTTLLNPDGTVKTTGAQQQQPIQAYVVETQLTTVQGNVSAIENAAIH